MRAPVEHTPSITSPLVGALEAVWLAIQQKHPEVPDVVLTLGSGTFGGPRGQVRLGHFAARRWQQKTGQQLHELFIGGEGLNRSAPDVLGTLLHEAAHALAVTRGIQDTSRQGRYHNQRFKALAEEFGITVSHAGSLGWSATTVADDTVTRYLDEVEQLDRVLVAYRHSEHGPIGTGGSGGGTGGDGSGGATGGGNGGRRNNNGVSATCSCGRRIRLARSTYHQGDIICALCTGIFATPSPQP